MTNKERLIANNAKIEEITKALAQKQVSPTDMLQQRVDGDNSCYGLFSSYKGTDLSFIKNLDTSNVTNMGQMFYSCSELTSLDVSNLVTTKVTDMKYMFYNCNKLTSLDVLNFDTSKVTNMSYMFQNCSRLTTLDLSNFNTSNVTDMKYMFENCSGLTNLDLSNFDTSKVTDMNYMFSGCTNLKTIIGKLDMRKVTSYNLSMFSNCVELENVTLLNLNRYIYLGSGTSYGTNLTIETLLNTIQELWHNPSSNQLLGLSTASKEKIANIYVKLVDVTDEMRIEDEYIDKKKPFVVCEPTDDGAMLITDYIVSKNWRI